MAYMFRGFLKPPQNLDLKLWRYLTLKKFEKLLLDSAIWFARADMFPDKLEGSYGLENNNPKYDVLYATPTTPPELRAQMRASARQHIWWMRLETYISCWHINDKESKRMWDEYTGGEGVCIQTTYRILKDELSKVGAGIELGFVRYIDHDKEFIGEYDEIAPFFYKDHRQFEFENELRAVWSFPPFVLKTGSRLAGEGNPVGCNVSVCKGNLIRSVVLHPNASSEFEERIRVLFEQNGMDAAMIMRSELD